MDRGCGARADRADAVYTSRAAAGAAKQRRAHRFPAWPLTQITASAHAPALAGAWPEQGRVDDCSQRMRNEKRLRLSVFRLLPQGLPTINAGHSLQVRLERYRPP